MDVKKLLEEFKKLFKNDEVKGEKSNSGKLPNFLIGCLSLILIGIVVVMGSDFFKSTSTVKMSTQENTTNIQQTSNINTDDYEQTAENKLKSVLEDIEGVGKVKVMLTIEGSEEQVPAVNINDSTSTTKEKDNTGGARETTQKNNGSTIVFANDGTKNQPLIIKTYKPKIVGVVVVAEGAKEKYIQLQVIQAVTRLYNLTPDKVSVYPMKK
jgi:stage III sporulation protein AG